jgi:hypothetical protein
VQAGVVGVESFEVYCSVARSMAFTFDRYPYTMQINVSFHSRKHPFFWGFYISEVRREGSIHGRSEDDCSICEVPHAYPIMHAHIYRYVTFKVGLMTTFSGSTVVAKSTR